MTRHGTDQVDGKILAECPNKEHQDDPHMLAVVEYSDSSLNDVVETFSDAWDACGECGAELDLLAQETPSEVLD